MGHKLGQVFLKDKNIVDKIIRFSHISESDHVVEIGCGDGDLSQALASMGQSLTIYEIDPVCIQSTKTTLGVPLDKDDPESHIRFIQGDILEQSLDKEPAKIVANLPYYISAKIVKWMISQGTKINSATVMLQKEFAQKLTAKPGEKVYTSLTVYSSYYLHTEWGFNVSRNCFQPKPKVDSAVIKLTPKAPPFEVDENVFFSIVRTSFWGRRKKVMTALKKSPYVKIDAAFQNDKGLEKFKDIRGEMLSLYDFYELYTHVLKYVLN